MDGDGTWRALQRILDFDNNQLPKNVLRLSWPMNDRSAQNWSLATPLNENSCFPSIRSKTKLRPPRFFLFFDLFLNSTNDSDFDLF